MSKLTARKIQTAGPGKYGDGNGLWLRIRKDGTKSWMLRFMLAGRSRDMGLGPLHIVSLAQARVAAARCREQLLAGIDPIDERRRERTAALGRMTFQECAEQFLNMREGDWSNPKHRKQWSSTLKTYAYPKLGNMPVNAIKTSEVMQVLEPIWREKTETASRLRGRIERILDWAKANEYRDGDNPARWRGHLKELLRAPSKVAPVKHHPALPYRDAPVFMKELCEQVGISARALEFAILTAARSGEVRGMKWDEIDGDTWIVPGERMKANKEHRVPLSERAQGIVEDMRSHGETGFVFKSQMRAGKPLSDMSLSAVLRRMGQEDVTVHGFRSTFRDWVAEQTAYPSDVAEAALAHTISNKVQAAYQRGDMLEKRQRLMTAWTDYCERPAIEGKVVPIDEGSKGGM